jgi:hypothetical protein
MADEVKKYLEQQVFQKRQVLKEAVKEYNEAKKLLEIHLEKERTGKMRRRKLPPPSPDESIVSSVEKRPLRKRVAPVIKKAIFSFKPGEQFSMVDVFNAMPNQSHDDYDRIRASVSNWLQKLVKGGAVKKVDWGVYIIPTKEGE